MSLAFLGGCAAVTNPNLKGLLMNVNTSATRGTVFSLVTLTDDVGKGLGPEVVALAVSACGRRVALSGAISCWWEGISLGDLRPIDGRVALYCLYYFMDI